MAENCPPSPSQSLYDWWHTHRLSDHSRHLFWGTNWDKSNWSCAERRDMCNLVLSGIEFWFSMNVILSLKNGQVIFCWTQYDFAQETQKKSGAFVSAFIKQGHLSGNGLISAALSGKEIPFLNKTWKKNVMRRLKYTDSDTGYMVILSHPNVPRPI